MNGVETTEAPVPGAPAAPFAGADPGRGPRFDAPVPPGGYIWWYLDGVSDDGRFAISLIAFVGSVFSPYYAAARRRGAGRADPENHVSINVALYRPEGGAGGPGPRWAMTERGRGALDRGVGHFRVGPSSLVWEDGLLTAEIEEIAVPVPRALKGRIRLRPSASTAESFALESGGRHRWRPIGPTAEIEVAFERPAVAWRGHGYLDSNWGTEPLERRFTEWDWSRAPLPGGRGAAIFYDPLVVDAAPQPLALAIAPDGRVREVEAPPRQALPSCLWGVARAARSDAGAAPKIAATLVDSPFYVRSLVDQRIDGQPTRAMHESLSLTRFDARWVQTLLPFRMPRRG
ncbi:MAG: carotenoid 1,2-hydratase [Alphaproteobacteria bacterium]|nr:carotenoid 1,2-hydratase [Alphaproteobacteria bacterium]